MSGHQDTTPIFEKPSEIKFYFTLFVIFLCVSVIWCGYHVVMLAMKKETISDLADIDNVYLKFITPVVIAILTGLGAENYDMGRGCYRRPSLVPWVAGTKPYC